MRSEQNKQVRSQDGQRVSFEGAVRILKARIVPFTKHAQVAPVQFLHLSGRTISLQAVDRE